MLDWGFVFTQDHAFVCERGSTPAQLFTALKELGPGSSFYDTVAFGFASDVYDVRITVWHMHYDEGSRDFILASRPQDFLPSSMNVTDHWHIVNYDPRHTPVPLAPHYEAVFITRCGISLIHYPSLPYLSVLLSASVSLHSAY